MKNDVNKSIDQLVSWVKKNRYRGYEPADGNLSWLHKITGGRVLPMRALQQVVLRTPFNIRPVLGIPPHESAIGRGYLAWAYLVMHRLNGDDSLRREAIDCLRWLMENRSSR
ncbi:hypothetical protein, partial [Nitrospira sp. BLG_2]|uniref:hypothetical protein n=1 Tax=Nitrospira sp. BLG_2 TaxID=3397507 RepID=UPI003B9AAF75